jgi:hypothetical protein
MAGGIVAMMIANVMRAIANAAAVPIRRLVA